MLAPIIADRARRPAAALLGVAALVLLALSLAFHGARQPTSLDTWTLNRLVGNIGVRTGRDLRHVTDPAVTVSATALVAVGAALLRRWNIAAWAVLSPSVAIVLTEYVLKPLVDRHLAFGCGGQLCVLSAHTFPSGHETGLASAAILAASLLVRAPVRRALKGAGLVVLLAWLVLGALTLVRNFNHEITDTIGAVCVSTVCVLGGALLTDALTPRIAARRRHPQGAIS